MSKFWLKIYSKINLIVTEKNLISNLDGFILDGWPLFKNRSKIPEIPPRQPTHFSDILERKYILNSNRKFFVNQRSIEHFWHKMKPITVNFRQK